MPGNSGRVEATGNWSVDGSVGHIHTVDHAVACVSVCLLPMPCWLSNYWLCVVVAAAATTASVSTMCQSTSFIQVSVAYLAPFNSREDAENDRQRQNRGTEILFQFPLFVTHLSVVFSCVWSLMHLKWNHTGKCYVSRGLKENQLLGFGENGNRIRSVRSNREKKAFSLWTHFEERGKLLGGRNNTRHNFG